MNSRFSLSLLGISLGAFVFAHAVIAQPLRGGGSPGSDRKIVEGVAALVGNEVILMSDVLQQAALAARQNRALNPEDPKVQRDVLNAIIDEKLLLTRAREDSVVVTDEELNRAVDYQMQRILSQFGGSVEKAESAYQMSMDKIRREAREILRGQYLVERVKQRQFADVKPSEKDMQEFYRIYKDSIPQVPEQVELASIALMAKPSAEARQATVNLAQAIIDSVKNGGDFADFARRYSEDPGSATNGGDNGFVEKGKFVPEYESAAKRLGLNEISAPVESPYGIHVIQVLDRRGDATRSRHILLRVKQSNAERDSLVARLQDLRRRALAGEDFAELARKYSGDDESRGLGGALGRIPTEQIPAEAKDKIAALKDGDITEPTPVVLSPTESGYQILKLVRRIPPHQLDPQQDRAQLERLATLYKQNLEYNKWVAELRTEIYWEIKTNF